MTGIDPGDRAEAAELLARYAERLDSGDFAGIGELFADAVFVDDTGTVYGSGPVEIAALYERATRRFAEGTPRTSHVITNVIVEPSPEGAPGELEMRSRFTVFQATDGVPLQPIVAGRYVDHVARRDGHMVFVSRFIEPWFWGDVSAHLFDPPAPTATGEVDELRRRVELFEAERDILDLVNRYGATLDDGDEDGFVACFTDDGVFVSTLAYPLDVRGAAALRAFAAAHTRAPEHIHKHCAFDTRVSVDLDAGTATAVSYFARLDLLADGPVIVAFGRYHDDVVRTVDGWRFARRAIAIEGLRPR